MRSSAARRDSQTEKVASTILRPAVLLALLWIVATQVNVGKAVHMDDPTYLLIARHIAEAPFQPMSGEFPLSGRMMTIADTNQPPLLLYVVALLTTAFGESIIVLHLAFSLFSALAILCFYGLGKRICPQSALGLTVILALGPAFLPGQNLMMDVPILSLWLLFFWIVMTRRVSWRSYLAAAVVVAAACLIKYTSLVLLPILCIAILARRDWRHAWTILVPVASLLAWSLINLFDTGAAHVLTRSIEPMGFRRIAGTLDTGLVCLGAVSPFSLLLIPSARGRRVWAWAVVGATAAGLLLHPLRNANPAPFAEALRNLFFANGLLVVLAASVLLGLERRPGSERAILLGSWLLLTAGFLVLFAPFMAVRHVLLILPPVLLAIGLGLEGRNARTWMPTACVLSTLLGGVIAVSDWEYAEVYRSQARRFRREYDAQGRLWYLGNWGWRWYAEAEGMRPYMLDPKSELRRGDVVIIAETPAGPKNVDQRDRSRLAIVETVAVHASRAALVRTMAPRGLGGYYATTPSTGLPWYISRRPLERFSIYRVVWVWSWRSGGGRAAAHGRAATRDGVPTPIRAGTAAKTRAGAGSRRP